MINYSTLGYKIKRTIFNYSEKFSKNLSKPQSKFITEMLYGILEGNKVHLSEISRSLKEDIPIKKTIERLSRNLNNFDNKEALMDAYIPVVKRHTKDEYAVIVIDNSDIAKPASQKMEALSEIRDGSTGEITQGYLTIEAAVLAKENKMPLPVYEKVFSPAENGFISETHENLECLRSLTKNFGTKCIRTLDRGFDANDYYRYLLSNNERFVIRAKKNRSVIYKGKTHNIMDVAKKFKGKYVINFKDRSGKNIQCKMSCIPVRLCEFPNKELVLVAVYGFGKEPMLLLSNLKMTEQKPLCNIVTKVYLLRWRIEEYFRLKNQQFDFEDIRVMSLKSIRNMNLLATLAVAIISLTSTIHKDTVFMMELEEAAKRIFGMPKFALYALGYAFKNVLTKSKTGIINFIIEKSTSQQLTLDECFDLAI